MRAIARSAVPKAIAQVLSSSLDLSLGKKSASFTNTTSVFIRQWERGAIGGGMKSELKLS
jgi:hypothetical protein